MGKGERGKGIREGGKRRGKGEKREDIRGGEEEDRGEERNGREGRSGNGKDRGREGERESGGHYLCPRVPSKLKKWCQQRPRSSKARWGQVLTFGRI